MSNMTESFPLKWPFGQKRTEKWQIRAAPFKTTLGKARDELLRELKLLGAANIVISSNIATYERGGQKIMYANQKALGDDQGVAVYYSWNKEQYALACDKWKTVEDNLQSLNKTVNAIRGIERWGTGEMMKSAFAGFKEIPEKIIIKEWFEVLGVNKNASPSQIKDAYRAKVMVHHPDKGGSTAAFNEVQTAYQKGMSIAE